MTYFINRLCEPSTWAAIAAIAGSAASATSGLAGGTVSVILGAIAAGAGTAAVTMKDHGAPDVH